MDELLATVRSASLQLEREIHPSTFTTQLGYKSIYHILLLLILVISRSNILFFSETISTITTIIVLWRMERIQVPGVDFFIDSTHFFQMEPVTEKNNKTFTVDSLFMYCFL